MHMFRAPLETMKRYTLLGFSSAFCHFGNFVSCSYVPMRETARLLDDEKQVALNENFSDHKFLDELQASMYEVFANLAKKLEVCSVKSNSERKKPYVWRCKRLPRGTTSSCSYSESFAFSCLWHSICI